MAQFKKNENHKKSFKKHQNSLGPQQNTKKCPTIVLI
jgi:hypothetical protein